MRKSTAKYLLHCGEMASVRPNTARVSFQATVATAFGTAKFIDSNDLSHHLVDKSMLILGLQMKCLKDNNAENLGFKKLGNPGETT